MEVRRTKEILNFVLFYFERISKIKNILEFKCGLLYTWNIFFPIIWLKFFNWRDSREWKKEYFVHPEMPRISISVIKLSRISKLKILMIKGVNECQLIVNSKSIDKVTHFYPRNNLLSWETTIYSKYLLAITI